LKIEWIFVGPELSNFSKVIGFIPKIPSNSHVPWQHGHGARCCPNLHPSGPGQCIELLRGFAWSENSWELMDFSWGYHWKYRWNKSFTSW
jgi:hypothetical protein